MKWHMEQSQAIEHPSGWIEPGKRHRVIDLKFDASQMMQPRCACLATQGLARYKSVHKLGKYPDETVWVCGQCLTADEGFEFTPENESPTQGETQLLLL